MLWICGLLLLLDLVWTHGPGPGPVFVSQQEAQQVLVRQRRANSFLEEMKAGNLERECREEICDYEEAREIFEDPEVTNDFWAKYFDGDACESSPCQNQGICKDIVGGFNCICKTGFEGHNCDTEILELCENQNGGCEHFCAAENGNMSCSCADGYSLSSDNQSCWSSDPFKCGVIIMDRTSILRTILHNHNKTQDEDQTETRFNETHRHSSGPNRTLDSDSGVDLGLESPDLEKIASQMATQLDVLNGYKCPPGQCPWQAMLLNEEHKVFCGGTILSDVIILTTAHCLNQSWTVSVVLGEWDLQVKHGNEAEHEVEKIVVHAKYRPETFHNDIALFKLKTPIRFRRYILPACLPTRDFTEKVLMREPSGLVSGFGLGSRPRSQVLQRLSVPYLDRARCLELTPFRVSTRMFCAGYEAGDEDSCLGDSGGPHVTRYRGTYFVTVVRSWGGACVQGRFGVYTQVSKYQNWIHEASRFLTEQNLSQNKDQDQDLDQDRPKRKRSSGAQTLDPLVLGPDQDPPRTRRSGPGSSQDRRPRGVQVLYL